jgi:hypothetical protein
VFVALDRWQRVQRAQAIHPGAALLAIAAHLFADGFG